LKEGFKQVRHKVADKSEDKIVEAFVILEKEHGPKATLILINLIIGAIMGHHASHF
jgi:hypothetical protein